MVGRRSFTFWGPAYFQGRTVSFRGCISFHQSDFPRGPFSKDSLTRYSRPLADFGAWRWSSISILDRTFERYHQNLMVAFWRKFHLGKVINILRCGKLVAPLFCSALGLLRVIYIDICIETLNTPQLESVGKLFPVQPLGNIKSWGFGIKHSTKTKILQMLHRDMIPWSGGLVT